MSPNPQAPADHPVVDGFYLDNNGAGRKRVSEIQRTRILAGLVEAAAEHGAANVTVAHIVARSGVSRRTFYELFVDRESCFLAAFDDAIRRIAATVLPAYEEPSRWREKIRAALLALLEFLDYERGVARLAIVEALGAGSEVLEHRRRVLDHAIAVLDQGRRETKGRNDPSPMVAEGVVGGVLAVLHSRLLASPRQPIVRDRSPATRTQPPAHDSLLELAGPLMSMIVLPYLGGAAARKELERSVPMRRAKPPGVSTDPLLGLEMRLTYRTVRVLMAVAEHPGSSNREVGLGSGMRDQGQTSKLLSRLYRLGLIQNMGVGPAKGAPNAWMLTPKGAEIEQTLTRQSTVKHAS